MMSADNYLSIEEDKNGKWKAFEGCASTDAPPSYLVFKAPNVKEAIEKANAYCEKNVVEYGYTLHFYG